MLDFRSCLRSLRKIVRPSRFRIAVSVTIGAVRVAASLCFVAVCKELVDIATGCSDGALVPHIWLMVAVMAVQLASGIAFSYWQNITSVKTQNDIRHKTFSHVMHTVWDGHDSFHSADAVNRLEEDVRVVVDLVCVRFPDVIITLFQLLAASAYLMTKAPNLGWILLALMVCAVVGSKMFFKKIRELTSEIRGLDSKVQSIMQESLQYRILVMTLGATEKVLRRLGYTQEQLVEKTYRRLDLNAVARGFMSFGFMSGYFAAFMWGVLGISRGTVTYGTMTMLLQLVGQVQRPIADLSRHVPAFIHALTSVERLEEITSIPLEKENGHVMLAGAPGVKVSDITFAYPGAQEKVFDHFSFDFVGGGLTAIMGPTGQGKSTLTRLVLALLTPSEGEISLVSGGDAVKASPETRCNFMYVPQGNSLMSGTIRDNLRLAASGATEEQMKHALHVAEADFVMDLPEGLDTLCSEKGGGLSEGQAQRISIARALLHEGGILILDEATSAIDSATETRLLTNLMTEYKGRKTILFVTHREAVLSYADAVLRLGGNN